MSDITILSLTLLLILIPRIDRVSQVNISETLVNLKPYDKKVVVCQKKGILEKEYGKYYNKR